ncbi:MAG: FmdB family zinc ribbon protein [Verrucomicrobiia bacterium]
MPSLDAGDNLLFQAVNRPHPEITFEKLVVGLEEFRREFSGQYWLEVLLVAGYTGLPAHVQKIAELVGLIQPDRVQLNTVVRPPAGDFAMPVPQVRLSELARLFKPRAEVIAEHHGKRKCGHVLEKRQSMSEPPLKECPRCKGVLRRLIGAGAGIFVKGGSSASESSSCTWGGSCGCTSGSCNLSSDS